jgi:hypothetical protein
MGVGLVILTGFNDSPFRPLISNWYEITEAARSVLLLAVFELGEFIWI